VFATARPLNARRAVLSLSVFAAVVAIAAMGWLPIAAAAFAARCC
jgi:hypothetical protein